MTERYRTQGFVLKKADRFEADRLFTVFTKDFGKLNIRAKAIRKINSKLKAGIEIFSLSEIEFIQGKSYKTLTDANFLDTNSGIIFDLNKLEVVSRIAKIVDSFVFGQECDEKIWGLLSSSFEKLNSQNFPTGKKRLFFYYFLWNFFAALGYNPETQKCSSCGQKLNPYNIFFSAKDGGVVCQQCAAPGFKAKKINSDCVKIIRLIIQNDWATLSKLRIEKKSKELFEQVTREYYLYLRPE